MTRRQMLGLWLGIAAVVVVIGGAMALLAMSWVGTYREATIAQARVTSLRTSIDARDWPGVTAQLPPTVAAARTLAESTDGVAWRFLAAMPVVGPTAEAVTDLSRALADVGQAAEPLAPYAERIVSGQVRRADGSLDLTAMQAVTPLLNQLADAMNSAHAMLAEVDVSAVRPEVAGPLIDLRDQLGAAVPSVTTASDLTTWLPDMMGANGTRLWLVLLENPAEARGSGGFIGGFVVMEAKDGRLTFKRSGSSSELAAMPIDSSKAPKDSRLLWGDILQRWGAFNATPHFPLTGALAASGMRAFGERVDGVIAIDPAAVAAMLELTGPITAQGKTVSADDVERFFTVDVYAEYPDSLERDEVSLAIVKQAFQAFLTASWDPAMLAEVLVGPVKQGRIRVWSARPDEQQWLSGTPVGGVVPKEPGPVIAIALNNTGQNKTDAFVTSTIAYRPGRCMTSTTQDSALTVTLRNDAPVALPADNYGYFRDPEAPRGTTQMLVHIYAPVGAGYLSSRLDGRAYPLYLGQELNRDVWWTYIDLPRRAKHTLEVKFTEPTVLGVEPRVLPQPMVIDQVITVEPVDACPGV